MTTIPDDLEVHKTLRRVIDARAAMFANKDDAEVLTGRHRRKPRLRHRPQRRLSGAPLGSGFGRGTFSQRHAVWVDQKDEHKYIPLTNAPHGRFEARQPAVRIWRARLRIWLCDGRSEEPVLWEAQFGDFANGAQIMIDQFIAAGEAVLGCAPMARAAAAARL